VTLNSFSVQDCSATRRRPRARATLLRVCSLPGVPSLQFVGSDPLNSLHHCGKGSIFCARLWHQSHILQLASSAGQAEHDTAQAKGWVEGATDSVIGNVKNVYGKVVGDKETEASGYAQATGGDAKKAANS